MQKIKTYSLYAGLLALFAAGVWWEYSLWDECLQTNSFWYCARVLNK